MYALIDNNGIVIQLQPNKQNGFTEVDNSICCGMKKEGDIFIVPTYIPTAEELDSQRKTALLEYWETIEIEINGKTFIGNQNNCTLMELKKSTLMDAEQTTFPAKYGFVTTDKIELQQVLNQVSALIDAKKIEIWGA